MPTCSDVDELQRWIYREEDASIVNVATGKCLDLIEGLTLHQRHLQEVGSGAGDQGLPSQAVVAPCRPAHLERGRETGGAQRWRWKEEHAYRGLT